MRFLVTGGCGFIGSAVVRALVERGDRVLNIDRRHRTMPVPALASVVGKPGYARLDADVTDRAMMRAVFREFMPEKVIHLASASSDETAFEIDVAGTFSVLEACREARKHHSDAAREAFRIVQAVRVSFLPENPDLPAAPPSPQEAMRNTAASLAADWACAHDIPLVVCSAGEVFGPWQSPAAFPSRLVRALVANQRFELEARGLHQRDWLPARDFANGLVCAARSSAPLARHELTLGAERRDIDIAEAIGDLIDERLGRPGGQSRARLIDVSGDGEPCAHPMLDATSAEQHLRWTPSGFHTGLDAMIGWSVGQAASGFRTVAAA